MNFFLLDTPDFFFCCVADDFPDGLVAAAVQTPDGAIHIIELRSNKENQWQHSYQDSLLYLLRIMQENPEPLVTIDFCFSFVFHSFES